MELQEGFPWGLPGSRLSRPTAASLLERACPGGRPCSPGEGPLRAWVRGQHDSLLKQQRPHSLTSGSQGTSGSWGETTRICLQEYGADFQQTAWSSWATVEGSVTQWKRGPQPRAHPSQGSGHPATREALPAPPSWDGPGPRGGLFLGAPRSSAPSCSHSLLRCDPQLLCLLLTANEPLTAGWAGVTS